jgi:hypothetical protein
MANDTASIHTVKRFLPHALTVPLTVPRSSQEGRFCVPQAGRMEAGIKQL